MHTPYIGHHWSNSRKQAKRNIGFLVVVVYILIFLIIQKNACKRTSKLTSKRAKANAS